MIYLGLVLPSRWAHLRKVNFIACYRVTSAVNTVVLRFLAKALFLYGNISLYNELMQNLFFNLCSTCALGDFAHFLVSQSCLRLIIVQLCNAFNYIAFFFANIIRATILFVINK